MCKIGEVMDVRFDKVQCWDLKGLLQGWFLASGVGVRWGALYSFIF